MGIDDVVIVVVVAAVIGGVVTVVVSVVCGGGVVVVVVVVAVVVAAAFVVVIIVVAIGGTVVFVVVVVLAYVSVSSCDRRHCEKMCKKLECKEAAAAELREQGASKSVIVPRISTSHGKILGAKGLTAE